MQIAALDGEACQREWIGPTMAAIGHECHGFGEGKSLLLEQSCDLLILDWTLPDIEGLSVAQRCRPSTAGAVGSSSSSAMCSIRNTP